MIVKVQIPIFLSNPEATCLVYDERRKHVVEQDISDGTRLSLGDDLKGYFMAKWNGFQWVIGRRVNEQPW